VHTLDLALRGRLTGKLGSNLGPLSGLEALSATSIRVHTAFHEYLRAACKKANIPHGDNAGITELFKLLRDTHPALTSLGATGTEVYKILRSMAAIVDALNQLRNRASVAHPNEALLPEAEAMLVIKSLRTLLHYLNAKLR